MLGPATSLPHDAGSMPACRPATKPWPSMDDP
jgi:hypothetical protein